MNVELEAGNFKIGGREFSGFIMSLDGTTYAVIDPAGLLPEDQSYLLGKGFVIEYNLLITEWIDE